MRIDDSGRSGRSRYGGLVSVPDPLPSAGPDRRPLAGSPTRELAAPAVRASRRSSTTGSRRACSTATTRPASVSRSTSSTRTYGVSKQPVMDALRRLSIDGLVEIIPQVGVEVARYEPAEIDDFFELFASAEATAAGLAASRRSDSQLAELDAVGARIEALTHHDDPAVRSHGYRVANREYHGVIHAMGQSRIIVDYAARLWDLSDFLINTSGAPLPLHSALEERHAEHETIRAALVRPGRRRRRRTHEAAHPRHRPTHPRRGQPGLSSFDRSPSGREAP